MALPTNWRELYRSLPRPTLSWVGVFCLPVAVFLPSVDASKLGVLTAFLVLLYGIREAGKAAGNE